MKKNILLLLFFFTAAALPAASLGWLVKGDLAVSPETGDIIMAESAIRLKLDHAFGADAAFSGRMRLRWRAPLDGDSAAVNPGGELIPELRDAWIDLFGVFSPALELRIGKQRLNYGKSDFFRHLDVVNPPDFSDPLRFDLRVPSWLVKLKLSIGYDAALEAFAGPGTEQPMYMQGMNGTDEQLPALSTVLGGVYNLTSSLDIPDAGTKSLVAGARFTAKVIGWDLSLLWVTRLSPLPLPEAIAAETGTMNGTVSFSEKREQYLGIGLAGDLLGLGARAEVLFRHHPGMTLAMSTNGIPAGTVPMVDRGWDILWSAGLDYQFKNGGPYISLEFSRGFIGEYTSGGEGINHYLALTMEQKWNADRIRLALTVGFEFDRIQDRFFSESWRNATAWFAGPELQLAVGDNLRFTAGLFWLDAPSGTTLAEAGFSTMVYLRFEGKM